jgi:hypothetical protein
LLVVDRFGSTLGKVGRSAARGRVPITYCFAIALPAQSAGFWNTSLAREGIGRRSTPVDRAELLIVARDDGLADFCRGAVFPIIPKLTAARRRGALRDRPVRSCPPLPLAALRPSAAPRAPFCRTPFCRTPVVPSLCRRLRRQPRFGRRYTTAWCKGRASSGVKLEDSHSNTVTLQRGVRWKSRLTVSSKMDCTW